jgi:hypothetical protein
MFECNPLGVTGGIGVIDMELLSVIRRCRSELRSQNSSLTDVLPFALNCSISLPVARISTGRFR